jgi:hypothetical protein
LSFPEPTLWLLTAAIERVTVFPFFNGDLFRKFPLLRSSFAFATLFGFGQFAILYDFRFSPREYVHSNHSADVLLVPFSLPWRI